MEKKLNLVLDLIIDGKSTKEIIQELEVNEVALGIQLSDKINLCRTALNNLEEAVELIANCFNKEVPDNEVKEEAEEEPAENVSTQNSEVKPTTTRKLSKAEVLQRLKIKKKGK